MRSNDVIWGLSGINTFEWSVLQEILVNSLPGVVAGDLTFFAGSLHLYERHFERSRVIAETAGADPYALGLPALRCTLTLDSLDSALEGFFRREERIAGGDWEAAVEAATGDSLFDAGLVLIAADVLARRDPGDPRVRELVAALDESDVMAAGLEYLERVRGCEGLTDLLTERVRAAVVGGALSALVLDEAALLRAIKSLHASKTAAYGTSWKKRGEQISVMCNLARKADRLAHISEHDGISTGDEDLSDTALDLFVYAVKHLTFLGRS